MGQNDGLDIPPPIFVTLANAIMPPLIFALAIGIPSAILYAIQFGMTIWKRNVFKSSFFKLFATRAFWSLIGLIGTFFHNRFGRLGWFLPFYSLMPPECLAFIYFLIVHAYHVENLSTAVLLLNRLSAMLFPAKYEKFWHNKMPLIIGLISLLPIILTGHILFYDEYVRIQMDNATFTLDNHPRPLDWNDPLVSACSSIIFTIICLLINFGIIFAYRWNLKQTGQKEHQFESNPQKMERKLTIYAIVSFVAQLLNAVYMLLLYIAATQTSQLGFGPATGQMLFLAVYNQLALVNDLSTIVVPSWLMLWASNLMQGQIKRILPLIKKEGKGPKIAWTETSKPNGTNNE